MRCSVSKRLAVLVLSIVSFAASPASAAAPDPESARRDLASLGIKSTQSTLDRAVSLGRADAVELLLAAGVGAVDRDRALIDAARAGNLRLVELLLRLPSNPNPKPNPESDRRRPAVDPEREAPEAWGPSETWGGAVEQPEERCESAFPVGRSALAEAARCGHLPVVRTLIAARADVNAPVEAHPGLTDRSTGVRRTLKATPLMMAALFGHAEVVEALLQAGADPGAADELGETALAFCALDGTVAGIDPETFRMSLLNQGGYAEPRRHAGVARVLLAHGAKPETQDRAGQRPLLFAAYTGNVEVVRLLLENKADASARNRRGDSVLHWAAGQGSVETVQALLEAGADRNAKDADGLTPLQLAARSGSGAVAALLLAGQSGDELSLYEASAGGLADVVKQRLAKGASAATARSGEDLPLVAAARFGHAEVVELLLAKGAKPTAEDGAGESAVVAAIGAGHVALGERLGKGAPGEVREGFAKLAREKGLGNPDAAGFARLAELGDLAGMELFLRAGVPVDEVGPGPKTALSAAAGAGQVEAIGWLVSHGAKVNLVVQSGPAPLHAAVRWGQAASVRALLARKAQPNVKDDGGLTPLMMAAENGCVPCAAALLSAGATATVAAANGARALDYAQRGGASEELVSLLSARDAPVRARALLAALDAGAVRAQPGCNPSALERAEARDRLGLVEKCVEVGTDPNLTFTFAGAMVPVSGYTLLMVAAETSRLGLARRLLGAGAKAGAAASDGTTALMLAAQAGSMELVSLLLSAGADPDAEARGKTAYQLAVDALAIDVARLLRTRMKHPPTLP